MLTKLNFKRFQSSFFEMKLHIISRLILLKYRHIKYQKFKLGFSEFSAIYLSEPACSFLTA